MSRDHGNVRTSIRGPGRGNASPRPDFGNSPGTRGGGTPVRANIKDGLDRIIEMITPPARLSAPEHIPIENTRYVASYNWVEGEEPTIVVPGSPGVWTGRELPFVLQDKGYHFLDQNGTRMSSYPFLPLFAAADAIRDKEAPVDWPAVDVITNRNGLRKLLRCLNPSRGQKARDFRIDVELVGSRTIVLSRWDDRPRELPSGRNFGFAFEAAMCRAAPGCPISDHHRVITYNMLDLKMVVHFEVDACLPTEAHDTTPAAEMGPSPAVDNLADAVGGITLSSVASSSSSLATIHVLRAGTHIPQDALLELATRKASSVKYLDWNELYPQLALAQVPTLRLGLHEHSRFTELREWQIIGTGAGTGASAGASSPPPDLTAQRRGTAAQIVRLAHVLEKVQELAISRGAGPAGCFSLVCENGELQVYARPGARSCLPSDVKTRFYRAVTGASLGA